jgi:hypothetical protein
MRVNRVLALAVGVTLQGIGSAQQVSPPVTLQWFESSWRNTERRTPDLFTAGYGALWTPPPGRAVYLPQGGGIGYDPYDRFDLGKPRDPTLYGTETGYKKLVREVQKTGGNVYVDYVHHHVGSFDMNLNGYTYPQSLIDQGYAFPALGNQTPYLRDRADYPGFELTDNFNNVLSNFHRDTYAYFPPGHPDRPFGNVFEYWFRLGENLVTIDLASAKSLSRQLVRNPVPGNAQNIRQSPENWQFPTATVLPGGLVGADTKFRQANVPTEANRALYPDLQGTSRTIIDRGVSYTVYDFNTANPMAGDPVPENPLGYMQRYAQWLTQVIGVDGLRIDAARHVPLGEFNSAYNPQSLNVPFDIDRATALGTLNRRNLDGTVRNSFNFQEVFNYDANFLKGFIRKTQQPGDTVHPNRDVLDFSLWAAMARNMTGNGLQNDWYQIRSASINAAVFNTLDPNIANNGANGIGFVYNHDEGVTPPGQGPGNTIVLDNVAHAWVLMRPGNAYVYYRSDEFNRSNNSQFFLKQGRGDALGGQFGNILTTLVDVRNSYGRGNFIERFIDNPGNPSLKSAIYAFERQGSAIVGLNIGYNPGVATRTMQTSFTPGTRLEEVTGNWQDPSGQVPRVITVNGSGQVTVPIPWNNAANGNKGYVVYGLPLPRGTASITRTDNSAFATFGNESGFNGTALISTVDVVTTDWFKIRLATNAVTLADGFRDTFADGDRAMFRINDGSVDGNGNGVLDFPSSAAANATKYGFENFLTTNLPGFGSGSGNGLYEQLVNATGLSEGYNYITIRAWRKQGTNESEVFKDFRKPIYVDRLPANTVVDAVNPQGAPNSTTRTATLRNTDQTGDNVHAFLNLGAGLTDAEVIALLQSNPAASQATRIDRDMWDKTFTQYPSGNSAITTVTYEPSGRASVQRTPGLFSLTTRGLGLGDVNLDSSYSASDVTFFETLLYPNGQGRTNLQFSPGGDLNADGLIDNRDLFALPALYQSLSQPVARAEAQAAVRRRGNLNGDGATNALDIDFLYDNLGSSAWLFDLDTSFSPANQSDVDVLVRTIFGTEYGDADLNGVIDFDDYALIDFGFLNNLTGWSNGDFDGSDGVDFDDYAIIDFYFLQQGGRGLSVFPEWMLQHRLDWFGRGYMDWLEGAAVPEPGCGLILMGFGALLGRRRR